MSAVTGIDLGALLLAISAMLPSGLSRLWCVIQFERMDALLPLRASPSMNRLQMEARAAELRSLMVRVCVSLFRSHLRR